MSMRMQADIERLTARVGDLENNVAELTKQLRVLWEEKAMRDAMVATPRKAAAPTKKAPANA